MDYADYFFVITGFLLLLVSFYLDKFFASFFKPPDLGVEHGRKKPTPVYIFMTYLSEPLLLVIAFFGMSLFVYTVLGMTEQAETSIIYLWIGISEIMILTYIVKILVARGRPMAEKFISFTRIYDYSFPSAHAAFVFGSLALIGSQSALSNLKIIWAAFAVIVALSRIYLEQHYFSDVVAGGLLGYFSGAILISGTSINSIVLGAVIAFFAMITLGKIFKSE